AFSRFRRASKRWNRKEEGQVGLSAAPRRSLSTSSEAHSREPQRLAGRNVPAPRPRRGCRSVENRSSTAPREWEGIHARSLPEEERPSERGSQNRDPCTPPLPTGRQKTPAGRLRRRPRSPGTWERSAGSDG